MNLLVVLALAARIPAQEMILPEDYCFQDQPAQVTASWLDAYQSHAAFTGRVIRVRGYDRRGDSFVSTNTGTATLRANRYVQGAGPSEIATPYRSGWDDSEGPSGWSPERGERYLVLLRQYEVTAVPERCVTDFDRAPVEQ